MREKRHKKWNRECKQKQSLLFSFCDIFDLLTSRTQKKALWPLVFKPDFYLFCYNEQLRKIYRNFIILYHTSLKGKMLHQKHESYKNAPPLKNWVDWITTRREKNVTNTKMVHFEKKCPEIKKKKHIFTLMTTFYNFTLEIETSWEEEEAHFGNLPMTLLCMFGLFILR